MPIDPTAAYDPDNIFAKMLRDEIPCNKVYEDEHALAFHDINPQADVHILVIPKGEYVSWDDFSAKASAEEMLYFLNRLDDSDLSPPSRANSMARIGGNPSLPAAAKRTLDSFLDEANWIIAGSEAIESRTECVVVRKSDASGPLLAFGGAPSAS